MQIASETEKRVLSLRERLVADRDTYLAQLERIGARSAGNGIGLTVLRGEGSDEQLPRETRELRRYTTTLQSLRQ